MSKREPGDRDMSRLQNAKATQAAPMDGAPGDAAVSPRYTFGITLAQVDALARLV